jgi:prepilin-type N-terminal cleavage/methylation domain-containing protein
MNTLLPSSPESKISRASRGFTLIELLTVIAIIGILAAIMIPTVSAVRESGRNAVCQSNLRQLGIAFQLYLAEHKDTIPKFKRGTFGDSTLTEIGWWSWGGINSKAESESRPLNAYIATAHKVNDVFSCPGDYTLGGIDGGANNRWSSAYGSSYICNQMLYSANGIPSYSMTEVRSPSKLVIMGDGTMYELDYTNWKTRAWHGKPRKHNLVAFDGHVVSTFITRNGLTIGNADGYVNTEKTMSWIDQ